MSANLIRKTARHFRILRGWRITGVQHAEYSGQVNIHPKKPEATVYLWKGKPPVDFEIHEVLHCALRALTRMDRRSQKELHQAEEELVQDICGAVTRLEESIRQDERRKVWREINERIVRGHLPGNGLDKQAERNGIVIAANTVAERMVSL